LHAKNWLICICNRRKTIKDLKDKIMSKNSLYLFLIFSLFTMISCGSQGPLDEKFKEYERTGKAMPVSKDEMADSISSVFFNILGVKFK
jgi:hypothetical protein